MQTSSTDVTEEADLAAEPGRLLLIRSALDRHDHVEFELNGKIHGAARRFVEEVREILNKEDGI